MICIYIYGKNKHIKGTLIYYETIMKEFNQLTNSTSPF